MSHYPNPRIITSYTAVYQGFEAAREAGAEEVAVFAAASETFSRRNINCSVAESLRRFEDVMAGAREAGIAVRGYVSCAVDCPYEVSAALEVDPLYGGTLK